MLCIPQPSTDQKFFGHLAEEVELRKLNKASSQMLHTQTGNCGMVTPVLNRAQKLCPLLHRLVHHGIERNVLLLARREFTVNHCKAVPLRFPCDLEDLVTLARQLQDVVDDLRL